MIVVNILLHMSTSRKKLQKYGYRTGTVTGQAKNFTIQYVVGANFSSLFQCRQ